MISETSWDIAHVTLSRIGFLFNQQGKFVYRDLKKHDYAVLVFDNEFEKLLPKMNIEVIHIRPWGDGKLLYLMGIMK